jgi:RHS repeat-associated protein
MVNMKLINAKSFFLICQIKILLSHKKMESGKKLFRYRKRKRISFKKENRILVKSLVPKQGYKNDIPLWQKSVKMEKLFLTLFAFLLLVSNVIGRAAEYWTANNAKTTIYADNYEKITENGITQPFCHISGGDGLAAICVKHPRQSGTMHYVHRNHLDSILSLTDANGTAVFKASYDAWRKQTVTTNTFKFHRGFTGHEHLSEFALINMNGRMYDPILGRFLSPDPYVQAPAFSQSFNRYSYCLNNPLKYTDPNGEFAWFYWVGAALIGGISNLVSNWDNVDGFWDGLTVFGVGAGAGAGVIATAGAGAGFWTVTGVAAAGGAIAGGTNSIVAQTGTNFSGFNDVNWGQVGTNSLIGSVGGAAGGAAGYWASNASFLVNNVSSPVLRSAAVSPLASGAEVRLPIFLPDSLSMMPLLIRSKELEKTWLLARLLVLQPQLEFLMPMA